jgi:phosphate transport system substrate-binding protein
MGPALADLAAAYQAQHPNVLVDLRNADSAVGMSELAASRADLAAVSWTPSGQATPGAYRAIPVGRDAIALIVHPSNRVRNLTITQVRALYRGEILDWEALNGTPAEPVLVSREEGSGTRAAFETLAMAGDRVTLNALVLPNSRAVVDYVASHRDAVGYVSLALLDDRVTALQIEDRLPTAANVRSGAYHLTRLLYLCVASTPEPYVQRFLDFVLSPAGQAQIGKHNVPLR